MLQNAVSPQDANVVAAGCLLAESALALFSSVLDKKPRMSSYELLESIENPDDSDALYYLIHEQLGRLLQACTARGRQGDEIQNILTQQMRSVQDRLSTVARFDG